MIATPLLRRLPSPALALAMVLAACSPSPGAGVERTPMAVRVAQFNIQEMGLDKVNEVDASGRGTHEQLVAAAAILREVRPDIVLINEIDILQEGEGELDGVWRLFQERYLAVGDDPLAYPFVYAAPVNTGVLSGYDLNKDGIVGTRADRGTRAHGDDSWGYGTYPGEYGMVIASRFPLDAAGARTFRDLRWSAMPGNLIPPGWFTPEEEALVRLSSKTHMVVPVDLNGRRIHLVASHPTPAGFDGPEDRNGRRNHDEVRLVRDILDDADYLVDDAGVRGGLPSDASFIVMGDLNAALRSDLVEGRLAIRQLLEHPRVRNTGDVCVSDGGLAGRTAGAPDFFEQATTAFRGGSRIDYVLPSTDLPVTGGGVHWPWAARDPAGAARAERASDHRLVWVDLSVR